MRRARSITASSHINQSPVASTSGTVLSATPRRSPRIRTPRQSTPSVLDKGTDGGDILAAEARTGQSRQRSKAPSPRIATNKREFSEAFSTSTPAPENDDNSDRRRPSRTTRNPSPRPLAKKKQKKKGSSARQVPSQPVQDPIKEGLDIVMCGMNSGGPALESGQYYSDKNSWFWELLEKSGLTDRVLRSTEADILLNQYGIGITVLIPDADIDMNKVPKLARPAYVPALIEKIGRYRPRVLTLSGVGVCEAFKLHFSCLPSGSGLDLTDNLGLQPISLSFPPRDPTDDSKRDKVFVWCVPYPHQMVSKWYPNEVQLELFRRMKDDLAQLKAGTLVLPSNHVEYRVEDLLPSDDSTAEEGPTEEEENKKNSNDIVPEEGSNRGEDEGRQGGAVLGDDSNIEIIEGGPEGGNDELVIIERDGPQTQGRVESREEAERSGDGRAAVSLTGAWQLGQGVESMVRSEDDCAASETGMVVQCGEYLNPWVDD